MKKILALVAGFAVIAGTATACQAINTQASDVSKAMLAVIMGRGDDAKACDAMPDVATLETAKETLTVPTKTECIAKYNANKTKDSTIAFQNIFVASTTKTAYNVGLIFSEQIGDVTKTYDAFVYFAAGSFDKPLKVTYTQR